jgi:threonine aldolase
VSPVKGAAKGADFRSDNVAPIAPELLAAIVAANSGTASAYGDDERSASLAAKFRAVFERDVQVFPLATGTAANALALSVITPPWGVIFCHEHSHIRSDECGAPELFTGGARVAGLPGDGGKIAPSALAKAIAGAAPHGAHNMQPGAVSISQSTEAGCVYTPAEVRALADVAHAAGIKLHMDGARLANAVASLGVSAADMTWRAGVDVLSFGATKNGAMAAEAIVCFDEADAATVVFRRKRAGQLFSKMRFVSAQLDAYLQEGMWLKNATRANAVASRLAAGIATLPGAAVLVPVQANEVFARLPERALAGLAERGFRFYSWEHALGPSSVRLVTSFNTRDDDVDAFLAAARAFAKP